MFKTLIIRLNFKFFLNLFVYSLRVWLSSLTLMLHKDMITVIKLKDFCHVWTGLVIIPRRLVMEELTVEMALMKERVSLQYCVFLDIKLDFNQTLLKCQQIFFNHFLNIYSMQTF
jgi:hypothetical protein